VIAPATEVTQLPSGLRVASEVRKTRGFDNVCVWSGERWPPLMLQSCVPSIYMRFHLGCGAHLDGGKPKRHAEAGQRKAHSALCKARLHVYLILLKARPADKL